MNKFVNVNASAETTNKHSEASGSWVSKPDETLTLYHSPFCGYCLRVLMVLKQLTVKVETKNIITDGKALSELLKGGGKRTVPCLHIEHNGQNFWMYESADIIEYLSKNFRKD